MPVLINKDTGYAENLPDSSGLQADTHEVPLVDAQGQLGSASSADAPGMLERGFKQPSPEQLNQLLKKAHYGSGEEMAKAAVEGASSALTMGLSTGAERLAGVPAEAINMRRDENPVAHALGEAAGLGVGILAGGAPQAIEKAAAMATAKLGTETFVGRIGSQAAKAAIENMMFTGGDEASKAFASDPNQSAETIVSNLGMSAVLGGAIGGLAKGTNELWSMGPGKSVEALMGAMKNRAGGVPAELKTAAGITLSPEMEGALSGNPEAQKAFQVLQESNSSSGAKAQKALDQFHTDIKAATGTALGKTEADIAELHNVSDYEAGATVKKSLESKLREQIAPISEAYEDFSSKFKNSDIDELIGHGPNGDPIRNSTNTSTLANKIAELGQENGWVKSPSSSQAKLLDRVLSELPMQKTAQDLRNYVSNLKASAPFGSENYYAVKQITKPMLEAQDAAVERAIGSKAPELLASYKQTQGQYREFKDLLETLNDRLHVGRHSGPESFMQNLAEMQPEDVIRRLSTKSDADLQKLLTEQFPEVSQSVQQHELNKVLKSTLDKSGEAIDPKKLFKKLQSMQPEQRSYLIGPEQQAKLDAIHGLLERVPAKMNTSGTAKTLDALWNNVPASATAMASMLMGHNPLAGFILGKIGSLVGKEVPDAVRLATLKFLGSEAPTSAAGLKEAISLADKGIKAEKQFQKAVKGVFSGEIKLEEPTAAQLEKLKTQVDAAMANPEHLMSIGGEANHYMPDHVAGVSAAAARSVQYLSSLKPNTLPAGILDLPRVASATEEGKYKEALRLAENPLLVLKSLQDGSLSVSEIQHMQAMYPALYNKMQQSVSEQMMDQVHSGKPIKYKTQMATSMFLGQPLSHSLSPGHIQSAQQAMMAVQQQRQAPVQGNGKRAAPSLSKMPNSYMTPQQERISHKQAK